VKLVIQIPCYNEEETLPITLAELPREVEGVDEVEWLVVDDGSEDRTAQVARDHGVDNVVSLTRNQGLARAFVRGLEASLAAGADVVVNTDADNQYDADDIPELVRPVLEGRADIVVGERPIGEMEHFSGVKRLLQRFGSWVVRVVSGTDVADAPSGFRAMSREAARRLKVFNEYTYTLETIIQAGHKGMAVTSVPIRTNQQTRPSRLIRSLPGYLRRQVLTIVRIFVTYRPFFFFAVLGLAVFGAGFLISLRFLYFYLTGDGAGHVQSLILSALLMGSGFFLGLVGLLADLISVNRKLLEELDARIGRMEETDDRVDNGESSTSGLRGEHGEHGARTG
jgi:glycosyltransferase involved in cell wall biosynthesis